MASGDLEHTGHVILKIVRKKVIHFHSGGDEAGFYIY